MASMKEIREHIASTSLTCIFINIKWDGPQIAETHFCAHGQSGARPIFRQTPTRWWAVCTVGGGVWGRCERHVKGRKNRLKVNLKVEVRGCGSTGGIPPLLQTQHIVFSNICLGVFCNIW